MKVDADGNTIFDDPAEQDLPPEDEPCHECALLRSQLATLTAEKEKAEEALRDRFAMAALTGILSADAHAAFVQAAIWAYKYADALIERRKGG